MLIILGLTLNKHLLNQPHANVYPSKPNSQPSGLVVLIKLGINLAERGVEEVKIKTL